MTEEWSADRQLLSELMCCADSAGANPNTSDVLSRHVLTPTVLGSGASGYAHKLANLLHSIRLDVGTSLEALASYLSSVVAVVTDMGAELSF